MKYEYFHIFLTTICEFNLALIKAQLEIYKMNS